MKGFVFELSTSWVLALILLLVFVVIISVFLLPGIWDSLARIINPIKTLSS